LNFYFLGNSIGFPDSTIPFLGAVVWNAKTAGKRFS
jgi:hypothetical protein